MRTFFLIVALLLGVAASAQVKLKHTTVDTWDMYSNDRDMFNEYNDCSVRAIATVFSLDYSTALELTYKFTRKHRRGMNATRMVQMVKSLDYTAQHFKVGGLNSKQFAKYMAMPNYDFIVISKTHVHALVYDKDKDMLVSYGNPTDTKLKIIYAVAIKR